MVKHRVDNLGLFRKEIKMMQLGPKEVRTIPCTYVQNKEEVAL